MGRNRDRDDPPAPRTCASCGRRIEPRARWARDWDRVRWCSDACRRHGVTAADRALERRILGLLEQRAAGATVCPSEVARATADDWRPLMEPVRRAARRLTAAGRVEIVQGGRVVDPSTARGRSASAACADAPPRGTGTGVPPLRRRRAARPDPEARASGGTAMTIVDERPQQRDGGSEHGQRRLLWTAVAAFAALLGTLWLWWPAGVVLGLAAGVVVTLHTGQRMHRAAQAEVLGVDDELWQEFRRLRVRLGDDWDAFRAAALAVTRLQSASATVLRNELGASTAQAQHLLGLLEREGFVGPPQGARPRPVRVAVEEEARLAELLRA